MSLANQCSDFGFDMDTTNFLPQRFKKKPYRFNCASDILLLKEVISVNPYTTIHSRQKWEEIAENLRIHFLVDGRRCRERTSLILNYYLSEENSSFRKIGNEEDIKERDKLLQELNELKAVSEAVAYSASKCAKIQKDSDLERSIESYNASIEERNNATSSSSSDEKDISGNPLKRKKKSKTKDLSVGVATNSNFMEKRHAAELALKREELALRKIELAQEQQRINIEKEKFEIEKRERQVRLELDLEAKRMEIAERQAMAELIKDLLKKQRYPNNKGDDIIDPH